MIRRRGLQASTALIDTYSETNDKDVDLGLDIVGQCFSYSKLWLF